MTRLQRRWMHIQPLRRSTMNVGFISRSELVLEIPMEVLAAVDGHAPSRNGHRHSEAVRGRRERSEVATRFTSRR